MFSQWMRSSRRISIDIQSNGIHFVAGSRKRQPVIEEVGEFAFMGAQSYWDQVTSALIELSKSIRLKDMPAIVCLPADTIKMQTISVPSQLSEAAIETEILQALHRELPGLKDSLAIDFSVLSKGRHQADIFFAALREDHLNHYLECFRVTDLSVKIIEVDVLSMQRLIFESMPHLIKSDSLLALVFCRKNNAMLCVFDQQKVIFHQQTYDNSFSIPPIIENAIEKVVVAGELDEIFMEKIENKFHRDICYLTKLDTFKFASHAEIKNFSAFLPSLGAFMRELPPW